MKKQHLISLAILMALFGCQSNKDRVPDFSDNIDYQYSETKYMDNHNNEEHIVSIKYFNKQNQLIEQVGHEFRVKYTYDDKGNLTETFSCRMYNCDIGWRSILVYDSSGNHVGTYTTLDTLVNMDTVKVEQVKFYDNKKRLIKELADRGKDVNNDKFEYWKFYQYENERILSAIETRNGDTVWVGTYDYNKSGNLIRINRKNREKYKNEQFEYDKSNRLINWTIDSNENPLIENTSYSVSNNTTAYEYNHKGQLIREVTYNHKGEKYRTFFYQYKDKKALIPT
jgi:YD repeat-containing protein